MATVAELLKSKGIADEVAAGLPKEVVEAMTGFISEADTKLQTATQKETEASELRRQAELDRNDITTYVEKYGNSLTDFAGTKAENEALKAALGSLKEQGFDVKIPVSEPAKAAVPGSPAVGGNRVDESVRNLASATAQLIKANNEHFRLFGTPLPDDPEDLASEAQRARKPLDVFAAEKYKFKERQTARETESYNARVKADADKLYEAKVRKDAEDRGSNPNLRTGESSRNSFIPKIKTDEFHKADGNVPSRQRHRKMLENIHADIEAAKSA